MAALMTSDADNIDRLAIEIAECKYSGLIVLPPDINQSYAEFAIVPNEKKIRFGMAAVKGVGVGAVEEVLHARDTDGEFSSISDFCRRVSTSKFNRKAWESLIKSGAFDRFASRSDMLFNLDTIIAYASRVQKEANTNQADLFGGLSDAVQVPDIIINNAPEQTPEREQLLWERELLGLYLSAHPLDKYDDYFAEQTVPLASLQTGHDKKAVVVGGVLSSVRTILTKSGSKMAFLKLEDKSGEGEVIVFPKTFEIIGSDITQDAVVKVSGKVSSSDRDGNLLGEAKVIADEVVFVTNDELDNYKKTGKNMRIPKIKSQAIMTNKAKKNRQTFDIPGVESANVTYSPIEDEPAKILYIHVKDPDNHNLLKDLKIHLNDHTGLSEIILVLGEDKKSALRLPYRVEISERLISSVSELYGSDCVVVK